MHKGQDQVNMVEVYTMIITASDCMKKKPGWAALTIQQPDIKL